MMSKWMGTLKTKRRLSMNLLLTMGYLKVFSKNVPLMWLFHSNMSCEKMVAIQHVS